MSTLPAIVNPKDLVKGIQRTLAARAGQGGDFLYLRLGKAGDWIYGAEDTEIEPGSEWAIHPGTIQSGFAAWGDGEQLGEELRGVTDDPVIQSTLPEVGAPWKPAVAFQLACMSGEDEGTVCLYNSTSKGGTRAVSDLLQKLVKQADAKPGSIVPVVELEVSSYKHKTYGKIFTPIFNVKRWESNAVLGGEAPEQEEATPEPEAEKPKRRKRRAAS